MKKRQSKRLLDRKTKTHMDDDYSLKVMYPIKTKKKNIYIYEWPALQIKPRIFVSNMSSVSKIRMIKQFELIAEENLQKGTAIPFFGTSAQNQKCQKNHKQYIAHNICQHKTHSPLIQEFKGYKNARIAFNGLGITAFVNEPIKGSSPNTCIARRGNWFFLITLRDIEAQTPITTYYGKTYIRENYEYNLPPNSPYEKEADEIGLLIFDVEDKQNLDRIKTNSITKLLAKKQ